MDPVFRKRASTNSQVIWVPWINNLARITITYKDNIFESW